MREKSIHRDAPSRQPVASSPSEISMLGVWQRHAWARQPIWSLARWRRTLKKLLG